MKSNIKKYYLFQAFNSLAFFAPVIVLFWQSHGLNMTQIMSLQSIYAIGALLLELPTGAFADRFGKKLSLIFGSFFFSLGLFWYSAGSFYWQFIIGELTCALGSAFISGADRAFIHQTLKSLGKEENFSKVEGRVRGFNQISQALGNILGGVIGTFSLGLTFIATGFSTLMAFVTSLSFTKTKIELPREEKTNYLKIIKESIQIIRSDKNVLWLTLFFSSINSLIFANFWFSQPYLQMLKIPTIYFGVIFAVFSLIAGILSTLTHKLDSLLKGKTFLTIGVISVLSTFLLGTFPSIYMAPFFAISTAVVIINQTLVGAKTLKLVSSERSATILSFQNLVRRLVYALIIPFLGLLTDRFGVMHALQFNALILAIILMILFAVKNKEVEI